MRHQLGLLILTAATATAGVLVAPSSVEARDHALDPPIFGTREPCQRLDLTQLDIDVDPSGTIRFEYADDGYDTCNEALQVRSFASGPAAVDNQHDPILTTVIPYVAEVESAGATGVTVEFDTDPCYTGVEIHLDGDTLHFSQVFGNGCQMTIHTDAAAPAQSAEIHVVQQTGAIQPPHIWTTVGDDWTVLTGLPSGTWYVKVFDGWAPGSMITVKGQFSQATPTVYGVADGSAVRIDLAPGWHAVGRFLSAG